MKQEFNWAMDQVKLPPEAEERILRALEEQKAGKAPRRPRRTWKTAFAAVAAAVLMTGTAFAAAYQAGVLDIFFQGDTSSLESYVQTAVGSAENEDYRFTVNSTYYDGMSIYAVVTLEGLTDQAAERLFSNQVFADYYAQLYGQEEFDALLLKDPDWLETSSRLEMFVTNIRDEFGNVVIGYEVPPQSEFPDESGRMISWKIKFDLFQWTGPTDMPFRVWVNFMGEDYAVAIPLNEVAKTAHLEPNYTICMDMPTNEQAIVREIYVTPTQIYYRMDYLSAARALQLENIEGDWFALRMQDGTIIKESQINLTGTGGWSDKTMQYESISTLKSLAFSDVSEVYSIILGDTEFPLDGSQPFPSELVLDLSHQQKAS